MSVDECILAYRVICEDVYSLTRMERWWHVAIPVNASLGPIARYKTSKLEHHVKRLVAEHLHGNPDACMRENRPGVCKVAVVAIEKSDVVLLRSYDDSKNDMIKDIKIWEAALATCAEPGIFEPSIIGPNRKVLFGGSAVAKNPVNTLWHEAQRQFPSDHDFSSGLGCLLSLGTGPPSLKERTGDPFNILKRLIEIATDTRRTAEIFEDQHVDLYDENRYVRLDPAEVGDVKFDAVKDLPAIMELTESYLRRRPQYFQVVGIAAHLRKLDSML
jgi:predicted acylesterase/phospholipase RssA